MIREEEEKAIGDLADVIAENLEKKRADVESLEVYVQGAQAKICLGRGDFRERFTQGYSTLLESIS